MPSEYVGNQPSPRECLDLLVLWWTARPQSRTLHMNGNTIQIGWTNATGLFSGSHQLHTFQDGMSWPAAAFQAVTLLRTMGFTEVGK